jgi:hypothetical protein
VPRAWRGWFAGGLVCAALWSGVPAAADPVLVAAGDIACDPGDPNFHGGAGTTARRPGRCRDRATAELIGRLHPDHVLMLGDAQYRDGLYPKFLASYGAPRSWGRWLQITKPVPGNHDYGLHRLRYDAAATGYYTYFGPVLSRYGPTATDPARGYYSFDVRMRNRRTGRSARWHVVALNSMCAGLLATVIGWRGGCAGDSAQVRWLRRDLKAHRMRCTLAFWHHPLFSSGSPKPRSRAVRPLWRVLHRYHAELVLNGNIHRYERFRPQTPTGKRSRRGIRQFIVGSGGESLVFSPRRRAKNSRRIIPRTYGVLRLVLHGPGRRHPKGWYEWDFRPAGRPADARDGGSADCVWRRQRPVGRPGV